MRNVRSLVQRGPAKSLLSMCDRTSVGRRAVNWLAMPKGVYPTLEDAWSVARSYKHAGHDHPDAVQIHLRLAEKPRPSDYPVLFWLSVLRTEGSRILDFGGNVGNLYHCYKHYLQESQSLGWTVYDLPSVVARGRSIARESNDDKICFTDSLETIDDCDIMLASGSLHYWEGTVGDLLRQVGCAPNHIIVNRCPLRDSGPQYATIQETSNYCVPCWVRNRDDVVRDFARHGYEPIDSWSVRELSLPMPFHPGYGVEFYTGIYFRKTLASSSLSGSHDWLPE